ncbi:hypothetical protein [Pontiella sulfatireligans]|uniref:Uncharacterized protein n=1 Tax=Pontiella sulfatireligans TaxID=2750658 RepID=A0A6C2UNV0_9BACT|nr:hypothetical protein [Pontiella sulfatireligans]VGO21739.1 hypothetical protein SCARR_03814 [Pontiella sulfatireligans]
MSKHMTPKQSPLDDSYGQYFLKLESDFHAVANYTGCAEINDATCSIEFAQQLVCINTECEAVLKKICKIIGPKNPADNMGHYKRTILGRFPEIHKAPVRVNRFHRTVHPFAAWNKAGGRLDWWNAYQDIKHHRDSNFEKANLKNTLEALSALLILELYLYAIVSSNGAEKLGGALLLWAPGMPRLEMAPSSEFLPHLPLHAKK